MSYFRTFSSARGLSLLEVMITLIIIGIVYLGSRSLFRTSHSLLLRSSAADISRFIRSNSALSYLGGLQTKVAVSIADNSLAVVSGPGLLAPSVSFSRLRLSPPVRIASGGFGDLDPTQIQLILRPTGSVTPGNIRIDTGSGDPGCSLIISLRGSIQTICD